MLTVLYRSPAAANLPAKLLLGLQLTVPLPTCVPLTITPLLAGSPQHHHPAGHRERHQGAAVRCQPACNGSQAPPLRSTCRAPLSVGPVTPAPAANLISKPTTRRLVCQVVARRWLRETSRHG